ncbi:hypothetical protein Bbelb_125620 [Branchiostoma belcheri]|nr:hypothetical protein Bbelb_125620 [Branchiostoma belcheri]
MNEPVPLTPTLAAGPKAWFEATCTSGPPPRLQQASAPRNTGMIDTRTEPCLRRSSLTLSRSHGKISLKMRQVEAIYVPCVRVRHDARDVMTATEEAQIDRHFCGMTPDGEGPHEPDNKVEKYCPLADMLRKVDPVTSCPRVDVRTHQAGPPAKQKRSSLGLSPDPAGQC